MTSPKYLLSAGGCLMGAVASLTSCSNAQKPKEDVPAHPNIIYILADDLGIGDIQPYCRSKAYALHRLMLEQLCQHLRDAR